MKSNGWQTDQPSTSRAKVTYMIQIAACMNENTQFAIYRVGCIDPSDVKAERVALNTFFSTCKTNKECLVKPIAY